MDQEETVKQSEEKFLSIISSLGKNKLQKALLAIFKREINVGLACKRVEIDELSKEMRDRIEKTNIIVYQKNYFEETGIIIIIIPHSDCGKIIQAIFNNKIKETFVLGSREQSCIQETGSIICISLLNVIADLVRKSFIPAFPKLLIDSNGTILKTVFLNGVRRDDIIISATLEIAEINSLSNIYITISPLLYSGILNLAK